jgi:hypothetical protein
MCLKKSVKKCSYECGTRAVRAASRCSSGCKNMMSVLCGPAPQYYFAMTQTLKLYESQNPTKKYSTCSGQGTNILENFLTGLKVKQKGTLYYTQYRLSIILPRWLESENPRSCRGNN